VIPPTLFAGLDHNPPEAIDDVLVGLDHTPVGDQGYEGGDAQFGQFFNEESFTITFGERAGHRNGDGQFPRYRPMFRNPQHGGLLLDSRDLRYGLVSQTIKKDYLLADVAPHDVDQVMGLGTAKRNLAGGGKLGNKKAF